ncbi:MAG TPA: hypothetical protein VFW77_01870 [Candidatus Saccharimonadales bacterium]|nr:hypothetical protein [Candidatus Saccharimonadales bacterium]
MIEIFETLPAEFRASSDPGEQLTLWRGDKAGMAVTGMTCRLGNGEQAEHLVYEMVRRGTDTINDLIDRQTDAHHMSPLISVTNAIVRAQRYAGRKKEETIYELRIPASKLILDPYGRGRLGDNNDSELFVIGSIEPSEIVGIKTNNDEVTASELLAPADQTGSMLTAVFAQAQLSHFPDNIEGVNDPTRQPNRFGEWDRSQTWVAEAAAV